MILGEEARAVRPVGAARGRSVHALGAPRTSTPAIVGWFAVPLVKLITICPELLAVVANDSTNAIFSPTVA